MLVTQRSANINCSNSPVVTGSTLTQGKGPLLIEDHVVGDGFNRATQA